MKTIVADAVTNGGHSTASSVTFAHTVGANGQRLLIVCVSIAQSSGAVTSATFNGVAMTKAINKVLVSGSNYECAIFYLVNPPTGTYNVVVNFSASSNYAVGAASFFFVNQASPADNTNSTSAASGAPVLSITTVEKALIIDSIISAAATARTQGAGQSVIHTQTINGGDSGAGSYKIATSAGSYNMSWDEGIGDGYAYCTASFKPTAAGAPALMEVFV